LTSYYTSLPMNKTIKLLCLILLSLPATGQMKPMDVASVARLRSELKEAAARMHSITANFLQEKEMSMMNEKITSEGKFYFRKEKQLRWEYIHPYKYVVIFNGDEVTVSDESHTSTFSTQNGREFREINRLIINSISGTILDDDQQFTTTFSETPGAAVVTLKPLTEGMASVLSRITLWIDKTSLTVNQLELTEANGDKTRITFSDKHLNVTIPDDTFRTP
jgi:outer membrane lipoprotein-sorting protein